MPRDLYLATGPGYGFSNVSKGGQEPLLQFRISRAKRISRRQADQNLIAYFFDGCKPLLDLSAQIRLEHLVFVIQLLIFSRLAQHFLFRIG